MGGVLILSVIVACHFHHGSTRVADAILAAYVDNTAHGPPINQRPFFVVGVIGLARPTNVEDGLRWNGFVHFLLEHFFWILDLWKSIRETVFLAEVYFFLSSLFHSFWWIATWCIVLLLHCLPGVLSGLFVHLPFWFSTSWLRHESWGGFGSST
jgi:hypothetical protein